MYVTIYKKNKTTLLLLCGMVNNIGFIKKIVGRHLVVVNVNSDFESSITAYFEQITKNV